MAVTVVCGGVVFHEYRYPAIPPVTLTVAVPVLLPKQFVGVLVPVIIIAEGWPTVTRPCTVHPLLGVVIVQV